MINELLGECAECEKPVLEFEDWRIEKGEVCHEECMNENCYPDSTKTAVAA